MRIDAVHFDCLQEGDRGPSLLLANRLFSRSCLRPDRALDNVGVDLNALIGQYSLTLLRIG